MPSLFTTLTGGPWQDPHGNVVALGTLVLNLSQDAQISGGGQAAPKTVSFALDSAGNVNGATVYGNDILSPAGTYYIAEVLNSGGSRVWGPEIWTLVSNTTTNPGLIVPTTASGGITVTVPTLQTNEVNNGTQSLLDLHAGSNITLTDNGLGRVTIAASSGGTVIQGVAVSSVTPQTGDTFRYNEYGDAQWDIATGFPAFYFMTSQLSGTGFTVLPATITPATFGTQSNLAATATETFMQRSTGAAGASLNLTTGVNWPQGGAAYISWGSLRRFSSRTRLGSTTNARYWVGLSEYQATIGTTSWATDTPNMNYAAFRYSNGTDTTIQAVTGTSNVAQTVVNTGVSVDTTNSVLFEIAFDGTRVNYFINGVRVAQITTNIMPSATLVLGNAVGDNKNNATSILQDTSHFRFTTK